MMCKEPWLESAGGSFRNDDQQASPSYPLNPTPWVRLLWSYPVVLYHTRSILGVDPAVVLPSLVYKTCGLRLASLSTVSDWWTVTREPEMQASWYYSVHREHKASIYDEATAQSKVLTYTHQTFSSRGWQWSHSFSSSTNILLAFERNCTFHCLWRILFAPLSSEKDDDD